MIKHFFYICIFSLMLSSVAHADPMDDIAAALFEKNSQPVQVKESLRKCSSDGDCRAVMVMCRWRPFSKKSEEYAMKVASVYTPQCVWPPPPVEPPAVRCIKSLCDILPDGRHY